MNRIDSENVVIVDGKRQFTDGPPGTILNAEFANGVQEEVVNTIEAAGLTPSSADLTQLSQAVSIISSQASGSVSHLVALNVVERTTPKAFALESVVYAPTLELWCAVGVADGVDAYIVTSPDGITWTEQANPLNTDLHAITWSPTLGLFCAVGDRFIDTYIVTSPDGVVWTEQANPANQASDHAYDVVWNDVLGAFITCGGEKWMESTDGVVWVQKGINVPTPLTFGVGYLNGVRVAIKQPTTGANQGDVYYSNDVGASWNLVQNTATGRVYPRGFVSPERNLANKFIVYWDDRAAPGVPGSGRIFSSTDGITWTEDYTDSTSLIDWGGAATIYNITVQFDSLSIVLNMAENDKIYSQPISDLTDASIKSSTFDAGKLRGGHWNGEYAVYLGAAAGQIYTSLRI